MSDRIKDLNSPSPWNMRIWDCKKNQWLCDGGDDALPYYGFDIRGGEVTAFQGIDWIYKQHKRWNDFIWERSTGLTDKNGKEIYEGDIMRFDAIDYEIYWSSDFSGWHNRRTDKGERIYGSNSFEEVTRFGSVIGNIHENPELLGGEE